MNIPIKTNQLKFDLNLNGFNERYSVFGIKTTQKYFPHGAAILDTPLLCNAVRSVYFSSGKLFYVLMEKGIENKRRLNEVLSQSDEGEYITIQEMNVHALNQRIILSLLLNALGTYETEFLRFNNITGHLYCFHPKWLRKGTKQNQNYILKIPCLEFAVTQDLCLSMAVRTFTSERLKDRIVFRKRKFEQYPKYILTANHTLRRKLSTDTEECFILRQTQGDRTEIPFMDLQNLKRFEASKMGVMRQILVRFNEKYTGICHLAFQFIDAYTVAESPKKLIRENAQAVRNLLAQTEIQIIDYIGDEYSSNFCSSIRENLKKKYGIEVSCGKRLSRKKLNLCVIHNALYYNGNQDPHDKRHEGFAVQHITLEDFMGNSEAAISTVVHELLIKQDIACKQISLFDWSALEMKSDLVFGMRAFLNEEERYFFMKIRPDGQFDIKEQKLDLFSMSEYMRCVNVFSDFDDAAGLIQYADGGINIIRETSWFTIPEIEKIHDELSAGNTYLRGKSRRQELLPSITDIKTFDQGNAKYYFVGIIGEGMKTGIRNATLIRRIEPYQNSDLRFDELLPLMNVVFVRNGQLTVLPFPFKYLKEYIRSLEMSG